MQILPSKIGLRYSYARSGARFFGLNAILAIIGITIGIAALIAGKWNAWKQLRSAAKTHMRAKPPCPNHARTASASDIDPAPRSETIMTVRRL